MPHEAPAIIPRNLLLDNQRDWRCRCRRLAALVLGLAGAGDGGVSNLSFRRQHHRQLDFVLIGRNVLQHRRDAGRRSASAVETLQGRLRLARQSGLGDAAGEAF